MKNAERAAKGRLYLDVRFKNIGSPKRYAVPASGWIRAIRQGLGMKSAQLAGRLRIRQPSMVSLEQSEARGTIELKTLRRAAAALDCQVVYALLPKKSLEKTVRDRARIVLRRRRAAVQHSMMLENQAVRARITEAELNEFVRQINPSRLWDDA